MTAPRMRHTAAVPKTGLTLDEVSAFVAAAYAAELPGTTPVYPTAGLRGQGLTLEARPDKDRSTDQEAHRG